MTELVVIGDTLLDRDVDGAADRRCPDAPALVLAEQSVVERPGGAGLAAVLAAADGRPVTLVTPIADDAGGARLRQLLADAGVSVYPLSMPGPTPEKIRLRAAGQVLLRWDRGGTGQPPGPPTAELVVMLRSAGAVLVSDYGRGTSRLTAVRSWLTETAAPVVWDPHPGGAPAVAGARLVTPNELELVAFTGVARAEGGRRLAALAHGAQRLRGQWRVGAVAVTLGGDGALLCHAGSTPLVLPVPSVATGDSCGAGDRFAVTAAGALADGALVSEAVERAVAEAADFVTAGGLPGAACGPVGTAAVPAGAPVCGLAGDGFAGASAAGDRAEATSLVARVRARAGTVVATGGCFDLLHAGHVATLEAARRLGDCLVVCVNSDASVAGLKGPDRPLVPQADRARLLAALGCVDAVVLFDEPTPVAVLAWLRPDIWVKGGDYAGGAADAPDLPEAELVRRWGGQTMIVPYLAGRSTTGMIAAVRRHHDRRAYAESAPHGSPGSNGHWQKGA